MARKPSEIKADIDAELALIEAAIEPHKTRIEELKAEKAEIINASGRRIGRIRARVLAGNAANKMTVEQFNEWRNMLMAEVQEDDREVIILAKLAEVEA